MLTAHRLSKTFELQNLFENASFSLNPGKRTGLVGPNGCGKTTLMRILMGFELPSSWHVSRDPHLRIGYLPQSFETDPSLTLDEIINQHTGNIPTLEGELSRVAQALAFQLSDRSLQLQYDDLLRRIQDIDTGRIKHIIGGLGLDDINPHLPAGKLSGGQQTRLSLALVLLHDPQLLLLDEPTNHLDIAMLEWLEAWLKSSPCAALIISHDRVFLDHTVTQILEMDPLKHSVRQYSGNYSDYVRQRQAEIEQQWSAYHDQQTEIHHVRQDIIRTQNQALHTEHESSFMRIRGVVYKQKGANDHQRRLAKKVAQKANSRQKKLDRLLDLDERVEKPRESRQIKLDFETNHHLSRSVLWLEDLNVGYHPSNPLLRGVNVDLHSGQRIVLTGPNGCGKTTLLRTIVGELQPLAGAVHLSSTVKMGYLTQDQAGLDPDLTAAETLQEYFPNETTARSFLAYFLFVGDESLKPVALLSYGQRTRLLLAKLVADGRNCLLLDEPINHLDIPSRTQFEQALGQYDGAVLAVVHDRYFIQHIADEIWWVENGGIRRRWELAESDQKIAGSDN
jgi:ATP-binding cassette subfamily F protein 3